MARKLTQLTQETIIVDGEMKESRERRVMTFDAEPPYVKLYLDTILFIHSIPKGYNGVLLAFLRRMSFASSGQKLYVNAEMKRDIARELSVSLDRINHALTDFVKGKIMFRVGTGTYQFNAKIFGKGDWSDIAEIRANITFNPDGTDFAAEIIKQDKITANKKSVKELEEAGQTTIFEALQEQTATQEPQEICICGESMNKQIGTYGEYWRCSDKACNKTKSKKKGA